MRIQQNSILKPAITKASRKNASLLIIPKTDPRIPKYASRFEELAGICIGGCIGEKHGVNYGGEPWPNKLITPSMEFAHAHCSDDIWNGWICSPFKLLLRHKQALLHEVAHLIAGGDAAHKKQWKQTLTDIGGNYGRMPLTKRVFMRNYMCAGDKYANCSDKRYSREGTTNSSA